MGREPVGVERTVEPATGCALQALQTVGSMLWPKQDCGGELNPSKLIVLEGA